MKTSSSGQIAVIIPAHNYGRFLDDCLGSVASQTVTPSEVIVMDDSSDDDTQAVCERRGVRYLRVEHRHVYLTRRDGMLATTAPFIVFLDADDMLGPTYLAECLAVMQLNDSLGIVTSGMRRFGGDSMVVNHREFNLERQNWIHAGSMVRRAALSASSAYSRPVPATQSHADWYVWREVIRAGWKAGRIAADSYLYRQHGENMMVNNVGPDYYSQASLGTEPITLVLPLSGREQYWPRIVEWMRKQTRVTDVLVIDSSSDPQFRQAVRLWMACLDVRSTKYISMPPSNGLADDDRRNGAAAFRAVQETMPRIYRHIMESVTTEYIMVVEDDVLPPTDAIEGLLHSMGRDVAAVSGLVPSRWKDDEAIAWDSARRILKTSDCISGVESVGGTGFGCLLLRRSAMLSAPPFHAGGKSGNYDTEFSSDVRANGWKWLMDCGVSCGHGEITILHQ